MKTKIRITLTISLLTLLLAGCSSPSPLILIADACDAATVAIPVLEASGVIDKGIGNIVLAYTAAVSEAASKATAELLTKDTPAQKAEKITSYFATAAVPLLPANVGPEVLAIVKAIESAVNLFLMQFNSPHAKKMIQDGKSDMNFSMGERHAMGGMQKRFAAAAGKAKGLIKK